MNLIFLGAPGAGKGTQAAIVSEKLGIPTISTGNLLRAAAAAGTKAGLEAKSYMDKGALVPDETVVGVLKDRIAEPDCEKGFLLDGFPRNTAQAQVLEDLGVKIDLVISLEVEDEEIMERMSGRRVCLKCGATFHVKNAPSTKGDLCDKCGDPLVIRADDKPETVADRLKVYHETTEPLKLFYGERDVLSEIKSTGIERTTTMILAVIEGWK
ncbi:MAG: adenylate kinase [Clostridia bacterium]|nr:adenylate kinase [Clostridia bacterium]MBQ3078145.1 adenylate kinase [Clostridia bacterium]